MRKLLTKENFYLYHFCKSKLFRQNKGSLILSRAITNSQGKTSTYLLAPPPPHPRIVTFVNRLLNVFTFCS